MTRETDRGDGTKLCNECHWKASVEYAEWDVLERKMTVDAFRAEFGQDPSDWAIPRYDFGDPEINKTALQAAEALMQERLGGVKVYEALEWAEVKNEARIIERESAPLLEALGDLMKMDVDEIQREGRCCEVLREMRQRAGKILTRDITEGGAG